MDLGLLIWSLESSVRPDAFEAPRTVLRLEFDDQPEDRRLWWFVNEGASCQVCLEDPGFDVDLYVGASLPDMIRVVRGDLSFTRAVDSDRLRVLGRAGVRRRLRAWLNLSPLARVRSRRREALD